MIKVYLLNYSIHEMARVEIFLGFSVEYRFFPLFFSQIAQFLHSFYSHCKN
jgi:hypothetical protein